MLRCIKLYQTARCTHKCIKLITDYARNDFIVIRKKNN